MPQDLDLIGLLTGRVKLLESDAETVQQRVYGVTLAEVTDLDDPKGLGRVKVKFPWLSQRVDSAWARIATAWAGGSRGTYLLPEVGDEVVVAFRHGDLKHPYILGFLWSESDRPPEPTPRLERRELRSKSGHRVVFDDLAANEALTLQSQGGHKFKLDDGSASPHISIQDSTGSLSIVIDSQSGKISISSQTGQVEVSAPAGAISLSAPSIDVHATGVLSLKGDSSVVINGGMVKIN
jgi:uncharacterized protein involved in type VI secretion and phage assembly